MKFYRVAWSKIKSRLPVVMRRSTLEEKIKDAANAGLRTGAMAGREIAVQEFSGNRVVIVSRHSLGVN